MPNTDDFKKNAGDAAQQAKEKAGKLAHDNRDKFAGVLGKLTSKIDEKTQGKYHDKLEKAQDAALKGADKLAEQRPDAGDGEAPTPPAPGQTPPPGV
ncbi:Rv0909 family putative TA system antitoxin [Flexivirga alba]|uniref:Rv0909 family putative TA system antitoxin n=1 Tax=Flexivirga alba TaxID=702742 RepID=A0ABW2ACE3_9MICO